MEISAETVIARGLLKRHDSKLYHMHATFVSAVRAHDDMFDLERFSEDPGAALNVMQNRHVLRGSLHRDRFERGYLQYWAIRFCQEHCPTMLSEIDLCQPIDTILSQINDPFWCQLRDEALEHSRRCDNPLCGRYAHFDGNAKVFRKCCRGGGRGELEEAAAGGTGEAAIVKGVSGKWNLETGPVSLRTRGKRRLLENDDLYEVERIEMSMIKNGMSFYILVLVPIYLIKWKGYPSSENTWEPEDNLTVVGREMLDEYLRTQPQGDFYTRDRADHEPDLVEDAEPDAPRCKSKLVSCTPRTSSDGRGHTAGTLVAFWACCYMFPPLEMILSESTNLVHHYMMLLFAHVHLPEFVGMDDMCHWARFAASGDRPQLCEKTREFHEETKKVGEACKRTKCA
ncbi:hypothetical protein KFL_003600140 [Klebsormidium nitens]|uniref:Chromo domain-containing protein n=1 Tax=Klebsormidium nitens TaxID=105231 RepID=A0A1Y1I9A7_KLENI|nr:hypothetical protein KFL_003600140 [Klebsormidium nitens]|eukprot:GAQ87554.1 hypothetical protein KFL_003600140 [Klebsormidium nitens]